MVPYRVMYMTFLLIGGAVMVTLAAKSFLVTGVALFGAWHGIRILTRN